MSKPHVYMHLSKRVQCFRPLYLITTIAFSFAPLLQISAQTVLPSGFAERQYAAGLTDATAMAFASDPCREFEAVALQACVPPRITFIDLVTVLLGSECTSSSSVLLARH